MLRCHAGDLCGGLDFIYGLLGLLWYLNVQDCYATGCIHQKLWGSFSDNPLLGLLHESSTIHLQSTPLTAPSKRSESAVGIGAYVITAVSLVDGAYSELNSPHSDQTQTHARSSLCSVTPLPSYPLQHALQSARPWPGPPATVPPSPVQSAHPLRVCPVKQDVKAERRGNSAR